MSQLDLFFLSTKKSRVGQMRKGKSRAPTRCTDKVTAIVIVAPMEESISGKVTLVQDSENRAKHFFTSSANELVCRESMLNLLSGVLDISADELSGYSIRRRSKKHHQKFIPLESVQDYQCLKRSLCVKNHVKLLVTKKEDGLANDGIEENIAKMVDAKLSKAVDEKVAQVVAEKFEQVEQKFEIVLGRVEGLAAELNNPPESPAEKESPEIDEITELLQSVDLQGSNLDKIKILVDQFQANKCKDGNHFSVKYKLNCQSLTLDLTNYADLPIKAGSNLLFGCGKELIELSIGDHDIVESKRLLVNLNDYRMDPNQDFAEEGFFIMEEPTFSSFGSNLERFLEKFKPTTSVCSSQVILPTVSVLHEYLPYVQDEVEDFDDYEILSASDISV